MAGIPSVVITTTGFSVLARLTGRSGGVADLNIAEYPGPLGIHGAAQTTQNIETDLIDRIVTGLTRGSGEVAAASATRNQRDIVFAGTAAEVQQYFDAQEWSDGLPVVAPTIAQVERFLKFTERAPDDAVAVLQSANLQATPWNIAVNAVMAGCRAEHLPLIIAAVEALGDERCSLNNIGSTSGIFPYVLINGTIVDQLGIQSGAQLVSRPPNTAIGRAVGLIVRNIAGFRPGSTYMGTFGYPLAIALAERAADSPWEPFHVGQGYDRNANTVTVGVTNNFGSSPAPYDRAGQSGAQIALELIAREIAGKTRLYSFPGRGPHAEKVMITLLLSPPVARSLAAAGYSKEDVKRHLYENTLMSLREFDWISRFTSISGITARERVDEGVFPSEFAGAPDDQVRILSSPGILHIVVCGDPHRNRLMVMEGGHTEPTTKPVVLPKGWERLLKESGT